MTRLATPEDTNDRTAMNAARWLRAAIAFVWIWTGAAVLHPYYRGLGASYLWPLGLPPEVMYITCVAEVVLGLRVALGRAATWITLLQLVMIAGFTVILSESEPMLWLDPLGMLAKNLALMVMIATAWLLEREGWSARAHWMLRGGMAGSWIVAGLLALASFLTTPSAEPQVRVLEWLGWVQLGVGVGILLRRGPVLRFLLGCSAVATIFATILASLSDAYSWLHPFGPLTKNVAILIGTLVLMTARSTADPPPQYDEAK